MHLVLIMLTSLVKIITAYNNERVIVAGATGYIGRQVVRELVSRGIPTTSLVRSLDIPKATLQLLQGSELSLCDVMETSSLDQVFSTTKPSAAIICLASRSGVSRDAWAIDYQAGANVVEALEKFGQQPTKQMQKQKVLPHCVFLSAFCVGKPLLQFQFAKLKLEERLRSSTLVTHSIPRPTAFFKSLDGQVESVQKGNPILFFGDGSTSANAICERDLAKFLVDCAVDSENIGMLQQTRNIGGPDVPAITKREQGQLIYETLGIPEKKRKFLSIPMQVLDTLIGTFVLLEQIISKLGMEKLRLRLDDAAEIARIVRYYASEPMVATADGEVQGKTRLRDHFAKISARGGQLEEIDKMTTTTGILEAFATNEYVQKKNS